MPPNKSPKNPCKGCEKPFSVKMLSDAGYCPKCEADRYQLHRQERERQFSAAMTTGLEKRKKLIASVQEEHKETEKDRKEIAARLVEQGKKHQDRIQQFRDANPALQEHYNETIENEQAQNKEIDEQKQAARRELAKRELARRHLLPYVKYTMPTYNDGWVHRDICRRLEKFSREVAEGKSPRLMLQMPPRHGKLISHEMLTLTKNGWSTHGELQPGDHVLHPKGHWVQVQAVSSDDEADVEIEFSNGQKIICHENHEWTVHDRRKSTNPEKNIKTLETKDLEKQVWLFTSGSRGSRARWQLPFTEAAQFGEKELLLDPYVLGVWLGDGTTGRPIITNSEADSIIFDRAFADKGFSASTRYVHPDYGTVALSFYKSPLLECLRALGVRHNKHIPGAYLKGSIEQRKALLAGLMDTDGHVEPNTGRCRFVTTSAALRDGVYEVAMTLGFSPYVTSVNPCESSSGIQGKKVVHTVGFQPTDYLPLRVPRKAEAQKISVRRRVSIKAICRVAPRPGKCIQVDSPDGLYCVGKQLIPTHNSLLASQKFPAWHLGRYPAHEFMVASYSASLANKFSKLTRTELRSEDHQNIFENCRLDEDDAAVDGWSTTQQGAYFPTGVGGPATGRGCHCLPLWAKIQTPNGNRTFEELLNNRHEVQYVLSYDGNHIARRKINAFIIRTSDHYYRIKTSAGTLEATGEHPVCVGFDGTRPLFRRVDDLRVGESVVAVEPETAAQDEAICTVPNVRGDHDQTVGQVPSGAKRVREPFSHLLKRLFRPASLNRLPTGTDVCRVFSNVLRMAVVGGQEKAGRSDAVLLFRRLLRKLSFSRVRRGASSFVFSRNAGMRSMWDGVHTQQTCGRMSGHTLLQPRMLREVANWSAYKPDQTFPWGSILPVRVQNVEETTPTSGLCRVWESGVRSAPSGRGQGKQRSGERRSGLSFVPCETSSTRTDSVIESIERIEGPVTVGDLEVEGSHSFLTESSNLLLNCLIIDDPVKNRDEADSATIRESIKDWYTSTAYTRLAPGGGVLVIQCMTGDTPVRMPDDTDRRLDSIRAGEVVATYRKGRKSTARVQAVRSNGRDSVYRITTTSGKVVRANARHPFLVHDDGGLKWVRTRALTSAHQIVISQDNGGSGKGSPVPTKVVKNPLAAEGCARHTTTNGNGQQAIDPPAAAGGHDSVPSSSTDTASPPMTMIKSSRIKVGYAPYAVAFLPHQEVRLIGKTVSVLTTATTPEKSEDYSATDATSQQDTLELSNWHIPSPAICGFTLDPIISIEYAGEDEVFDLQIEETENFIANGMVSHNTRWHDDDLSGWLETQGDKDEGDQWEIVRYPAIALEDDKYRKKGEALHPDRYPIEALERIKKAVGLRDWNALYQQNPVPDDGDFFKKNDLRFYEEQERPPLEDLAIYAAADFAIGERQQNDSTVIYIAGIDRDMRMWILDRYKGQWGTMMIIKSLCLAHRTWKPEMFGGEKGHIEQTLSPVLNEYKYKPEYNAPSLFLRPLSPGRNDKVARARPFQAMVESHQVYFPANAPWLPDALQEILRFPLGAHDDDVDSLAWLGKMIELFSPVPEAKVEKPKSWRDKLSKYVTSSTTGRKHSPMAS